MSKPPGPFKQLRDGKPAADTDNWDRKMRALTLRNAGATYPKIAETFGISELLAKRWVRAAIREVVELPADQMVQRQRAILLDLNRANYQAALGGDRDAQLMVLRCLEHEAKLFGLYAPQRVNVGISEADFAQQAADLLAAVGPAPLRELAGLRDVDTPANGENRSAGASAPGIGIPDDVVDAEVVDADVIEPEPELEPELEDEAWSNL